jgi:D-alanyl-D-alanine carboxypeptidase/D-alanyl-D-alanine-endopeptidase (penicillin-binding protein 4)
LTACHATTRPASLPSAPQRAKTNTALDALREQIDTLLANPSLAHGYWGVLVRSLKDDATLYALNKDKLMLPASNMKIVTLVAAAEKLGWGYRYETLVGTAGSIVDGELRGDLIVVGGGDPSLVAADDMADRVFGDWAERLKKQGIRTITGRVIGDDNAFEEDTLGFGWSWDDLQDDDAAGVGGLQYNESAVRVTVVPGPAAGDSAGISIEPPGSGLTIVNSVTSGAPGTKASIAARRLPGSMTLELRGSIPVGAGASTLTCSVDNPTLFFASALRLALIAHGIDIRGPAVDIDDVNGPPLTPRITPAFVASYRSPPLSDLAMRLMKISQNQYAETLLKTIGRAPGVPAGAAAGAAFVQATLERWGLPASTLIQRDGSGLSRYDFITPEALVAVLTHVDRDPRLKGPFVASLPVAGRDGTLARRMKGTAAEGNVRAKTGSMTGVRGLSGYVMSADGEPLVFSILANNFDTSPDTVTATSDAILVRLAQFRR